MKHWLLATTMAAALSATAAAQPAPAPTPTLTRVAGFDQQVTGVAATRDGRVFVNFPRWEKDVPVSVGEVMKDGSVRPYPDEGWNSYRNGHEVSVGDHFVCVQSVVVDPTGAALWVVDPAAPGNEFIKPGGPKLVKIDLATNKVVQVVRFDTTLVPQGSYINDVRFTPDARWAFLTDSGQRGALLVVDTATGKARRVLDGDKRTQVQPGVVPTADGHELRRPDNRIPSFAADGLATSPDGRYVYWQDLVGTKLYRVPVTSLTNAALPPARLAAAVEEVATTHVADGLWMDRAGFLFITDPANNSVDMRAPGGQTTTVAKDDRLRWPDSMAEAADGSIYVTASHIQDMAMFHDKGSTQQGPWELFRIEQPHGK